MKAITYSEFGPAKDALQFKEVEVPSPKAGEVLIEMKTSGVNPSDIRARAGGRPGISKPPFPEIIPHSDGAGVIVSVGESINPSRVGERVWVWNGQWQRAYGTAAQFIALPSEQAVELPDNVSFEVGATLGIPALTACHCVLGAGQIEDKTILISGGAGTVGRIAVQIAKAFGAHVLATAHGEGETQAARDAGADEVFDYRSTNLADEILSYTGNKLIDRVFEVEFGKNIDTISEVIAPGGSIATIGSALEMTPVLPFYPLLFKAVSLDFVLVYLLDAKARQNAIKNLTNLLKRNALDIRIFKVFDLEDCIKAHELIESGQRAGSVILKI